MTQEERLEIMKMFASGKHEIVFEKNVEYEIGNVENGGIGVQINQGGAAAPKKDGRKKSNGTPKVVENVFEYVYLNEPDGMLRLTKVYQYLKKAGWLADTTKPETFLDLFKGTPKSFTLKWTGEQSDLYSLFKMLFDRKLIKPVGSTKWVVLGAHLVDKNSRPLDDWNSQKVPTTTLPVVKRLVNILDIAEEQID